MLALAISKSKFISLTFDDGPSIYTNQILTILNHYHIKATFFVVGEAIIKYPEIIKQLKKENHVLGNHTWNHPSITDLTSVELSDQILQTNLAINDILGEEPTLFRAPYGDLNQASRSVIHHLGLTSVLWNVDSLDWSINDSSLLVKRIQTHTTTDSIILLHDGDQFGSGPRDVTIHALPKIIEDLMNEGFHFLTIPEFHNQCFTIEKWRNKKQIKSNSDYIFKIKNDRYILKNH